jgi:hypothetical protein
VLKFVEANLKDNKLRAGDLLTEESSIDDILMVIYSLIYTNSNDEVNYSVVKLNSLIENTRFKFNDFMIIKEEE